jgi:hypothetical protein
VDLGLAREKEREALGERGGGAHPSSAASTPFLSGRPSSSFTCLGHDSAVGGLALQSVALVEKQVHAAQMSARRRCVHPSNKSCCCGGGCVNAGRVAVAEEAREAAQTLAKSFW